MANDLVPTQRNPIVAVGNALARANFFPGLSEASGGRPRTVLIGRMLAGAGDSDLLMANLVCLPRSETYGIALFGEPAGPTFKTHPVQMKSRYDLDDPGAVGMFIDWRYRLNDTPIVASFDPSCAGAFVEVAELLTDQFELPIDVIFIAARDEATPGLVKRLRQVVERVTVARLPTLSSRFDPTDDLEVPALPKILAGDYALAEKPLRELAAALPPGSLATFLSSLRRFASKLEVTFDE